MSDLTQFNFHGAGVRVITDAHGEPWFALVDLLKILGIARRPAAVVERLDDDVRQTYPIKDSMGRDQNAIFVSEAGLYDVIVRSDSPRAKPFRRWVTSEVLPSIRRTGSYGQQVLEGPELLARAVIEAQALIAAKDERIAELERPAAAWAAHMDAAGDYSLRDAAQILARDHGIDTGQDRLAAWLRAARWIDTRGVPYQSRIDQGHLAARARTYEHPRTGEQVAALPQVRVTPRGLDLIRRRMTGESALVLAKAL